MATDFSCSEVYNEVLVGVVFSEELRVRFSLQDIRKSVQRRGGRLTVSLHFLSSGELDEEINLLIGYYESLLDQPQRNFSMDAARALVGEYRMTHCLVATLSHWYSWRQRSWADVVMKLGGNEELLALAAAPQLRLLLYSYVNEHYQGFLTQSQRAEALALFARHYAITAADLDYLLALDSEEEAYLFREAGEPPAAQEVASLYNQWTFEAALFNASSVRFVIDCLAFQRLERPSEPSQVPAAGVGAVIKRLCYLARRLGVYYDLEYETAASPPVSQQERTPHAPVLLNLTLYGPQEVTGAPQQYGLRLARLCRYLLGYGLKTSMKKPQLSAAIVEAEARVHFLQRAYSFMMDAKLLQLLPAPIASVSAGEESPVDSSQLFDSSIEQSFSEAFVSLAKDRGVDGWQLEREPEPLLLDKGIFIPDFALSRGTRRIYAEILGFWTPAYRERKIQKLNYLRGREDLILAIPDDAREAFASIANDFPIVYYHQQLSIVDILHILHQQYDDFQERLSLIDGDQVRQLVLQQGFLAERDCYVLLHCYRRSELQQAAAQLCAEAQGQITFVAGLGLLHYSWLTALEEKFVNWLQQASATAAVSWPQALQQLRGSVPVLQDCEDAVLETLISLWPAIRLQRASIFEITVELADAALVTPSQMQNIPPQEPALPIKKPARERRAPLKKRVAPPPEATQGDLWG
ncbi:DUF790 family protein [Dictyobacter arantiisoli]|uniref:DUF790 family protein n=1 Tax=Dictyobacter arantiisoli TaxID=2014874 RepID=A0A5A5T6E9_9CHLR|nr:DUF790 family protein [Dictyobacter arantiisoli]GCF06609.1 hypothetical protein KDI_01730 [Dictyobacter arantiisoli]